MFDHQPDGTKYCPLMRLVRNVIHGAIAGAVATAAMDAVWYRRYRADGGDRSPLEWELSASADDFGDDAPAPARVGKLIADTVGVELPPTSVAATNNVVHWMTGIGWGKVAGLAVAATGGRVPAIVVGAGTGLTAWGASYALLGKLGIYRPINEYDRDTLLKDLSAHLVFGTTLGAVLSVCGRRASRGR
jgi:hypothetical protein